MAGIKVSSNVGKDKPKKKIVGYKTTTTPSGKTTDVQIKAAKAATPMTVKKEYTPADERTGDKAYGKESKTNPTPGFVKDAQAKKQDIVEKDGLKYRAGQTSLKITAGKAGESAKSLKVPSLVTTKTAVYADDEPQSKGQKKTKLKKRGMTYGGSDASGKGKTTYVNKKSPGARNNPKVKVRLK